MQPFPRLDPLLGIAAVIVVCLLLLAGLAGFGIWDPWEIEVAESARRLLEGHATGATPQLGPLLVSFGFRVFGVDEWSGRLPIALCGLATLGLLYALTASFAGRRTAIYAVVVAGTSPLLIFNGRTMLGEAPTFALQTALVLLGSLAVFGANTRERAGSGLRLGLLVGALLVAGLAIRERGALLGALPPLGAVALAAALDGRLGMRRSDPIGFICTVVLWAVVLVLTFAVGAAVIADQAGYSYLLGGSPQGGQPPSFEVMIGRSFHTFAPWSALLPLALAQLAFGSGSEAEVGAGETPQSRQRPLQLLCLLWPALSYAALTLFLSRYGDRAAVFPLGALSVAVALLLRDLEQSRVAKWPAAIAVGLLSLLLLRDYALYPNAPLHALPVAEFTVPEVFNPKLAWALVLGVFGAMAVLGFGAYPAEQTAGLRSTLLAPYRLLATQWRRGWSYRVWLLVFAAVLLGFEVFGVLSFAAAKPLGLSTLAAKWGKRLMLLPPALPVLLAALQLVVFAYERLRDRRALPILGAGALVGLYSAFGFMPALSEHFSPREVYESYNALTGEGEGLIEYKVGTRAAAYYAKGQATEADSLGTLMEALTADRRSWAVFPSEELPSIDRSFRTRTGRHLFVADARSAKVTLATNKPVPGREDQSFIARFVKREEPKIQHRVDANFDDKIMLLGYDLKLPHGDHVGAGESFELTWYWKARKPVPGSYRVFVHIDAQSMRIHGDHDPVDGHYPIRLWETDDVIVDQQRLEVPPNYPAGPYTLFVGLYSGETRIPVKEGAHDSDNRVNAGVLRIR